ncbi:uncharacterized protein N7483_011523 [Penicillium malachiteum]|uniref:uncharacterized protein n=1 Tax=Penicillium malachiteum TaxID=1324776 RepID=UPI002547AE62|nr:uncharacterized protein N7483_011523 [Penicillium malachiteum]KAJ5714342.1 hypothetical protein N7483_011523 [Penicillium malachiteum]
MHDRPVIIAPAPSQSRIDSAPPSVMPFTCQPCVRRKVKCDRSVPACLSCGKAKLECIYQPPAARACKRKRVDMDEHKRLARCEQMFQEHGILTPADATMAAGPSSYRNNNNIDIIAKKSLQSTPELSHLPLQASNSNQSDAGTTGKLLSGDGKSRYIDSSLWLDAEEVDMREISEHEEEEEEHDPTAIGPGSLTEDPISGALLGGHVDAMKLWTVHVHNVEPLCKILHIPTTTNMVEIASQQPATASKANECLLFAIYHSAVFSMTDEDCVQEFSQSRTPLMLLYRNAFQQALVNASWLKTTEMPVLQALVLFLVAMRTQMDPHTFWILTGVAVRIAQRMGLHRDGESLGLPPFDVEIRRRLFWQLLPLEGYAGQVSGTGIALAPDSWDTKQPLNINDDQIYPGMTQQPFEQEGASEMIFCLTRTEMSNFYTRTGVRMKEVGASIQFRASTELESAIDRVLGIIEAKYLRYCDIVNPLHFLTLGIARSAANAVRLRNRMKKRANIDDRERRELFHLAQTILDTDIVLCSNPNMKNFQWQIKAFFLWDALLCMLTSLAKVGFLSSAELDTTWRKMGEIYSNHPEILEARKGGALHIAVGKLTLKAWAANSPSDYDCPAEPAFITTLRSLYRETKPKIKGSADYNNTSNPNGNDDNDDNITNDAVTEESLSPSLEDIFASLDGAKLDFGENNFNLGSADWTFWDQSYR